MTTRWPLDENCSISTDLHSLDEFFREEKFRWLPSKNKEVHKFSRQITMLNFRTSFHHSTNPVKILQFPDLSMKIDTLIQCETAGTVDEAWFIWWTRIQLSNDREKVKNLNAEKSNLWEKNLKIKVVRKIVFSFVMILSKMSVRGFVIYRGSAEM